MTLLRNWARAIPRPLRAALLVSLTSVSLILLGGCAAAAGNASPGDDAAARNIAGAFAKALSAGNGDAACQLMALQTRRTLETDTGADCKEAITSLGLDAEGAVRSAVAYGRTAQARLESDVIFLAFEAGGWRVRAAGCEFQPERPYDCDLKGD
jgi:hypothetical protein